MPSDERSAGADSANAPTVPVRPERVQRERPYVGRPFVLGTIHPSTNEIRELAQTLGLELVLEVYQPRSRPHPGTFFGKGRLGALRTGLDEWRAGIHPEGWVPVDDHWRASATATGEDDEAGWDETAWGGTAWSAPASDADGDEPGQTARPPSLPRWRDDVIMILDEDVRPAVLFNLEERLGIEVWDRTRLILEIFSQHAHVKEAKLQVELAKLQYEIPLIHEAVHRRRSGERPGFRGGGEYGVADYEDFIKRRMRTVKDDLEHIRQERDVRRKVRREQFYLVSLAGYTNAGKSSLLNALTGAGTLSENTLFSTLATTTRRLRGRARGETDDRTGAGGTPLHPVEGHGGKGKRAGEHTDRTEPAGAGTSEHERPVLLTDTVGFIQALPSWLLDAFHSTLEEIGVSDVVLLVADVSDPVEVLLHKVQVCRSELAFLDVTCPIILVLNKRDLVPQRAIDVKRARLQAEQLARDDLTVVVSSLTGKGVADLVGAVNAALPAMIPFKASIPATGEGNRLVSRIYQWGAVHQIDYGKRVEVVGECDPLYWKELLKDGLEAGARVGRRSS